MNLPFSISIDNILKKKKNPDQCWGEPTKKRLLSCGSSQLHGDAYQGTETLAER
jgi:hypothetical protein